MESAYEKRINLHQLDSFGKSEGEENLMFLRYLYRREEDAELRRELRAAMKKLEQKLTALKTAEY